MKHKIVLFLAFIIVAGILAGCTGTTVVIGNCTCPSGSHTPGPSIPTEGALKTGLAIITDLSGSVDAKQADYSVTIVAVTVDDNGVIHDCIIDGIAAKIGIDANGAITSDLNAPIQTKNELGDKYGMVQIGGAKFEWYQQAQALADFAKGRTVQELKNGAIDETGKAPAGSDLASTATIYLGGYVSAIEAAVAGAKHLGAQAGDQLKLAVINSASGTAATADKNGTAQLNCDVAVVTEKSGVITSCFIDSLQAKVSFNASGKITTDLSAAVLTKNQLGDSYGMVEMGGAKFEWYNQAASFAFYVTGKTAAQVAGIAVSEGKPSDADLAASVTISIGGFQALIAKAMA